jgi:hypothetical protein
MPFKPLKVPKIENFFGSDFKFCTIFIVIYALNIKIL